MTTPNPTPASPEPEPRAAATPDDQSGRLRRGWMLGLGAGLAIVAVLLLVLRTQPGASGSGTSSTGRTPGVDRTNPAAVGSAFTARYAAHDPAVCALAAPTYRTALDRAGRCAGRAAGPTPTVVTLFGPIVCGDRAGLATQVTPPGQLELPYAFVVLETAGGTWTVRSLLPLADRSMISSYACDTATPDDGG